MDKLSPTTVVINTEGGATSYILGRAYVESVEIDRETGEFVLRFYAPDLITEYERNKHV